MTGKIFSLCPVRIHVVMSRLLCCGRWRLNISCIRE